MEMHHPCNFDNGDEYADFCLDEAFGFFYKDPGYENDEDDDEDDEDDEPNYSVDKHPERELVEDLMREEYYNEIVEFWDEFMEDNNCD
jgi:hypothetical protein